MCLSLDFSNEWPRKLWTFFVFGTLPVLLSPFSFGNTLNEDEELAGTVTTVAWQYRTTEYIHTEWRFSISGVHPIMMEKSALAGEGGGALHAPPPFYSSYHNVQSCSVVVRSCWEGWYVHSLFFISTPICTLWVVESEVTLSPPWVRVWDVSTGLCLFTLLGHDNWVRGTSLPSYQFIFYSFSVVDPFLVGSVSRAAASRACWSGSVTDPTRLT